MRVIVCHNHYQQRGGEDQVFADECELLRSHGHQVATFTRHNDDVKVTSAPRVAADAIWNREVAKELTAEIRSFRADVVHFHNTLPLISPAAFRAAAKAGAAVVLTLHNYRLMCPKATFFRDGENCELCLGRTPLPAIRFGCYRDSRAATATVSSMMVTHRLMGTYRRCIHAYIALCEFARQKHFDAGIPHDRLELKPNFLINDPGRGSGDGGYMMYLGRLSPEKGLSVMLDAWVNHGIDHPLRVVGQGPLVNDVREAAAKNPRITLHESESREQIMRGLQGAQALILPSIYYEGFPKTIVESLACGTPVISSHTGAMGELIRPGVSGMHFTTGDPEALTNCVKRAVADPSLLSSMRRTARKQFEDNFTPDVNYSMLMEIYQRRDRTPRRWRCFATD